MTANLLTRNDPRMSHPGTVRESIARMSDRELHAVERPDLVDMIRLAGLVVPGENVDERVAWASSADVQRLAFLVRRCCRNQLDSYSHARGAEPAWADAI